ncbi:hypothetical protein F4679DRAFT_531514 [Xylaria curta]|nr:hypothetical protein F4679DRAFT_531514 [Xylaria curta]
MTKTALSVEAIVAIIGLVVSLPPTVLVLLRYIKRHRQEQRGGVLPHTMAQLRPPHGSYRQYYYATNRAPNGDPTYSFVEEQYSLSQTITLKRASPYHPP